MRALAIQQQPSNRSVRPIPRSLPPVEAPAPVLVEPPDETDAWWLSRSQAATFSRRRITLTAEHARALRAVGAPQGRMAVEFNGATFGGASVTANGGRYELDLGDALAEAMAEVLDEDDGLEIELLTGRAQPTLAIHPFVSAAR